jgi:site-specific DNA-methyltransferase (adenine-specific)
MTEKRDNGEMVWNRVELGDCLEVGGGLSGCQFDLIYADPPFFTKRDHSGESRAHQTAGDGDLGLHFGDRWRGGLEEYLEWLEDRVRILRGLLADSGVFLLHLDWHAVHYAKVMCDQVFGVERFQNEIVWYYQTGGASKDRFSRKHDTILCYSRGAKFYFDGKAAAIPRTPKAMKRAQCATGARIRADDTHKNPDDVLTIPALNPMANERTGYPTQKPVELLERLIRALCPVQGAVGDFFCGSGTTLVAAKRLGRHYFGCDVSAKAVALARRRLEAMG